MVKVYLLNIVGRVSIRAVLMAGKKPALQICAPEY